MDDEVVVVVEIPKGGRSKFEIDPRTGTVWLDRVLSTATQYPAEYGYVLGAAGEDGDPLDAVVLVEERTVPGCHVRARPIGVLSMADEEGPDSKVLCVALGDPSMGDYADIADVSPHILEEIEHFFRVYKQLEPRKSVRVGGWHGAAAARDLIVRCRERAGRLPSDDRHLLLDLDQPHADLLREILAGEFRSLGDALAATDDAHVRQSLEQRESLLEALLEQAGHPRPDRA
jgi:inorganic pyrophosphatase